MGTAQVRKVRDEEFDAWSDAIALGFNNPQGRGDGERRRKWLDLDRCWGAFADGKPVGTFIGIPLELTVPGNTTVAVDGITGVSVGAAHRRQGLLSRMMAGELAEAKGRGESIAVLIAAEWPIYGRFGYGPATETADWTLDARCAVFVGDLPGTVELVDQATARAEGPVVYDRYRLLTPGNINREPVQWDYALNLVRRDGKDPQDELYALCRDEEGTAVGFVRYSFGPEKWTNQRPDMKLRAIDLFATEARYEARLWKYLADHDWVSEVYTEERIGAADPLWRDLLVDRRVAWPKSAWEGMWLRILDPVAALSARAYEAAGRIVLRITDKDGYAEGTFALEAGPGGATCAASTESPDVTVPVDVLGSIYLGGFTADRYRRLGRIEEHTPGAAAVLNALFRTAAAPVNSTMF